MPNIWKSEIIADGERKCLFATSERKVRALAKQEPALEEVTSVKRVQMPDRLDDLCDWMNRVFVR